jgi:hypothetical protein
MPRRVSLPKADELFRPTVVGPAGSDADPAEAEEDDSAPRRTSGRVKHDEKMTVYVTSDELLELEHARLTLRRNNAIVADRGRIVREAIAMVLEDLEANGGDSAIVRRLAGS